MLPLDFYENLINQFLVKIYEASDFFGKKYEFSRKNWYSISLAQVYMKKMYVMIQISDFFKLFRFQFLYYD